MAILLCILVFQSLLTPSATPPPGHFARATTCASSATGSSHPPLDHDCRTLDCCALGCASHDSSCLDGAFASAHIAPWSALSPTRRPGDARSRPLVARLVFVARGPPAAI
ncbi:hypothetical protein [Methylosinus sp. C49]|uniref:hypothetical protein n=1 Tax=Methylosinus sp. C49 TaxID=2699395 RepID=UPI0013796A12|nr:hypothetical protein [Methylosinus sp. C49]